MNDPNLLLKVMLNKVTDAVVITDPAARILDFNPAAELLTGWTHAEVQGLPIELAFEMRESSTDTLMLNPAYTAIREQSSIVPLTLPLMVSRGGRRMAVQISATPLITEGIVTGSVIFFRDVSESVQLAERLVYLTQFDGLTGLPNRILFVDRLEQATKVADRYSNHVAVLFVDLEAIELAQVKHSYPEIRAVAGPAVADRLLKEIASRLTNSLRESDTVSRLGSTEFVLLLPGITALGDIETLAVKLLVELSRPYVLDGQTLKAECNIGISLYPRDASDAPTLMRLADAAMSQSKLAGANQYKFAGQHQEPVVFINAGAPLSAQPRHR